MPQPPKKGQTVRLSTPETPKGYPTFGSPEFKDCWEAGQRVFTVAKTDETRVHFEGTGNPFVVTGRFHSGELQWEPWVPANPTPILTAADILRAGLGHMEDRAATYDKPQGERSMAATVAAFKATTSIELTEEQGWHFMCLLKLVRSQQGNFKLDNYEDLAAYAGLAGEAANKKRVV